MITATSSSCSFIGNVALNIACFQTGCLLAQPTFGEIFSSCNFYALVELGEAYRVVFAIDADCVCIYYLPLAFNVVHASLRTIPDVGAAPYTPQNAQ